ncbi:MAG: ZIP family metal transporter [Verrucomicrobiales bacterium]|nr:ZIP family metal transporter [Verrucomicrobiales bacterium]
MLWIKPSDPNKLKLLIAFSGAYLLSITVLHLLPEVFTGDDRGAYFGSFVLVGFFIQVMLEYLSGGIEHGHAHTHRSAGLPVGLMIGLCLHAFLEGMPLGGGDAGHSHEHSHSHGVEPLLLGIVLHKYPVAMVFLAMLLNSGLGKPKAFGLLAVFAAMAPLGTLLSGVEMVGQYNRESLAIVIGIFLHVSTTILFESSEDHRFNAYKMMAIAVGLALAAASMLLNAH